MVKIGDAAAMLGVAVSTLRKWESTGELLPARKTAGGTRYYDANQLQGLGDADAPTVCYARVSSHDQKADLERQHAMLEAYCAAKGWRSQVIKDLGSGMNYRKKDLSKDVLEIITVFSARLYGSRSKKNKQLMDALKDATCTAPTK